MGLLERWDRRNQETVEYHNDTADSLEDMASALFGRRFWTMTAAFCVFSVLLGVILRATGLSEDAAAAARTAILVAITVALFVWAAHQARRRRAQWRRDRNPLESPR